jgi:hypothetical protein
MPDSVLDILKLVLLVLLYLFFARVLWAVWSEVRQPANGRAGADYAAAGRGSGPSPVAPSGTEPTPAGGAPRELRPLQHSRRDQPTKLVVIDPKERRGLAFPIGDSLSVGRDADNAVHIDDNYLSSHHAVIGLSGTSGNVVLTDLGSRNGTFLNGNRLAEPRTLKIGDRIQIGYTVFEAQA